MIGNIHTMTPIRSEHYNRCRALSLMTIDILSSAVLLPSHCFLTSCSMYGLNSNSQSSSILKNVIYFFNVFCKSNVA